MPEGLHAAPRSSTLAATVEAGEPGISVGDRSLWFRWTAPAHGYLQMARGVTAQILYTGSTLDTLVQHSVIKGSSVWQTDPPSRVRVRAGEIYHIAVRDSGADPDGPALSFEFGHQFDGSPPAYDDFSFAAALADTEAPAPLTVELRHCGPEPGEPALPPSHDLSAWVRWTVPVTAGYRISAASADFISPRGGYPIVPEVFAGVSLASLTTPSAYGYTGFSDGSAVYLFSAGTEIRIRLTGPLTLLQYPPLVGDTGTADRPGRVTLNVQPLPPAAGNDLFAAAETIPGEFGPAVRGNLGFSTAEAGETLQGEQRSVWYRWTPVEAGPSDIITETAEGGAPTVTVWRGSGGIASLVRLTAMEGLDASWQEPLNATRFTRVTVPAGQTLFLQVHGSDNAGTLPFTLRIVSAPWPRRPEDTVAGRIQLAGPAPLQSTVPFAGAIDWSHGLPTVYYSWTAPSAGTWDVQIPGKSSATHRLVLLDLEGRILNDQSRAGQEIYRIPESTRSLVTTAAGETVLCSLTARRTPERWEPADAVTLSILPVARPANDDWRDATDVGSVRDFSLPLPLNGATREADESSPTGSGDWFRSVWVRWTAPASGGWNLMVSGRPDVIVEAFTGSSLAGLEHYNSTSYSKPGHFLFSPGVTYYFRTTTYAPVDAGTLTLMPDAEVKRPPNDNFADAQQLPSQWSLDLTGSARPASWEAFENYIDPSSGTVWYRWTAPEVGVLLIFSDTAGRVNVYPENLPPPGLPLGAYRTSDNTNTDFSSAVPVMGGQSYLFQVISWASSPAPFEVTMRKQLTASPANDQRAAASVLLPPAGASLTVIDGSLRGATRDQLSDYLDDYGSDVWYRWQAPQSGHCYLGVRFRLPEADVLFSEDNRRRVQCFPAGGSESVATFSWSGETLFPVIAGQFYDIRICGPNTGNTTDFTLTCGLLPPAANDTAATALAVTDSAWTPLSSLAGATAAPGDPRYDASSPTVWFTWTAPATGAFQFSLRSAPAERVNGGIYSGSPGNLTEEFFLSGYAPDINDFLETPGEHLRGTLHGYFRAIAGTRYFVMVRPDGEEYEFPASLACRVRIQPVAEPPNDAFAAAVDLASSAAVTRAGTVAGAGFEPGEPPGDSYDNPTPAGVWYRWTAPATGEWSITAQAGCSLLPLNLFTGTALANLQAVTCADSRFIVPTGQNCFIRVSSPGWGSSSSSPQFLLDIHPVAAPPRVLSVQFSPSAIDLSRGDAWIKVLLELDTPSGLTGADLKLMNSTLQQSCGGMFFGVAGNAASQRLTGDANRGTYLFIIPITTSVFPDLYRLQLSLELPDHTGEVPDTSWPGGIVPTVNLTGTAPAKQRSTGTLTILPSPLPPDYAGPLTLRATINTPRAMFTGGRIDFGANYFSGVSSSIALTPANRVSGTPWLGTYEVSFQLPPATVGWSSSFALKLQPEDSRSSDTLLAVVSAGVVRAPFADFTGPLIFPAVISPADIDVTGGPGAVTCTVRVMDVENGVRSGTLVLQGQQHRGSILTQEFARISGTAQDGIYQAVITIPAGTPSDIYSPQARFIDTGGNAGEQWFCNTYGGRSLPLRVRNSAPTDQTAPAVLSMEISPATLTLSAAPAVSHGTLLASDDFSGVASGSIILGDRFGTPVAQATFGAAQRTAGDALSGTYRIPLSLPANPDAVSGPSRAVIRLTDFSGKTRVWDFPSDAGGDITVILPGLINPGAGPYQQWLAGQPGLTSSSAHPLADADADGVPNLLQMAIAPGSLQLVTTPAGPELRGTLSGDLLFRPASVSLAAETSFDLASWLPPAPVQPDGAGYFSVLLPWQEQHPKAWLRLRAAFVP